MASTAAFGHDHGHVTVTSHHIADRIRPRESSRSIHTGDRPTKTPLFYNTRASVPYQVRGRVSLKVALALSAI